MHPSAGSSKIRRDDADSTSLKPPAPTFSLRPSTLSTPSASIFGTPAEGRTVAGVSDRSAIATSSRTLREENAQLKSEIAKLRDGRSLLPAGVATTSSKTRLEMASLKKQLEEANRSSRLREINGMVRAAQELDLAFLFDATQSMDRYMEVVKDKILKIAHGISDAYPESLIRVAFVFYRDYSDNEVCGHCDFTTDFQGSKSKFVQALAQVKATGGADTAEDVFSGLEELAKLNWASHNRVVYHIADAPCHGTRFHDPNVGDSYPVGDLRGRDIENLLGTLRQDSKLSTYTFLHISKETHKMLKVFKQVVRADNAWIREDEFEGMGIEDIPTKVVTACTSTISHSLITMASGRMRVANGDFVPKDVQTEIPRWEEIRLQEGRVYKFRSYVDVEEVLRYIKGGVSLELGRTQSVQVKVGLYPFSKDGASRWPFYAQIVNEDDTKVVVVKRFKEKLGEDTTKVHNKDKYIEQMEVQIVSAYFAEDFNHCIRNIPEAKKVRFTIVSTLEVQPNICYNMEKLLSGLWTKFNNNAGYVNAKESCADTLQAFSHWTHHRSKGLVMVTDLQGVRISSVGTGAFLLCDPAIHSKEVLRFTKTNLGAKGFELFFKSHKCNIICKKLALDLSMHTL